MRHAATSPHWRTAALLSGAAWAVVLAAACGGGGDEPEATVTQPGGPGMPGPAGQVQPGPALARAATTPTAIQALPCGTPPSPTPRAQARAPVDPEHDLTVQLQMITALDLGLHPPATIAEPFDE